MLLQETYSYAIHTMYINADNC